MRRARHPGPEVYDSPPVLVATVARIVSEVLEAHPAGVLVDPCAGTGNLLEAFRSDARLSVREFDLHPRADRVEHLDFLGPRAAAREVFLGKGQNSEDAPSDLLFVMNPPFSAARNRRGVVQFLRRCESLMRSGERVVSVVPITMLAWKRQSQLPPSLHLEAEHVYPKRSARNVFRDVRAGGRKKRVPCCVVCFVKRAEDPAPRFALVPPSGHLPFEVVTGTEDDVEWCVRRMGSSQDIGMLLRVSAREPAGNPRGKCVLRFENGTRATCRASAVTHGTVYGLRFPNHEDAPAKETVLDRLREVFASGAYLEHFAAGVRDVVCTLGQDELAHAFLHGFPARSTFGVVRRVLDP